MIPSTNPEENLKQGLYTETGGYDPAAFAKPGESPVANPLVQRYSQAPSDPLSKARNDLMKQYAAGSTPPDPNSIREQVRSQLQAQVDATDRYYNDLVAREQQAGEVRNARVRGVNVRAGLIGSDFASANAENQAEANRGAISAIENERALKLSAIFDKIDERAQKRIETETALAKANAEQRVALLSQIQGEARNDVLSIAKGGFSLEKFKQDAAYSQILEESGLSEFELDALYNANLPKKAAKDINYQKIGNNKIAAFWVGDDGTIQKQEYDFEIPAEKELKVIDGVPYLYDPATQVLAPAKGFTPKSGTPPVAGEDPQLYSGLSSSTATAVRAKASAFKTEAVVQNFATVQEGYNFARALSNTTQNPADDQALIYSLAKALDPGSVVREGEYATAQKYAQSWINAYGKGVEQAILGTGFLSESARKNIKQTIEQKYQASKKSYDNLYSQYESGVNSLTGRKDGAAFLTDYRIQSDPSSELESDIQAGANSGDTREQIIEKLSTAYPELSKEQIAEKVYTLIPDKT